VQASITEFLLLLDGINLVLKINLRTRPKHLIKNNINIVNYICSLPKIIVVAWLNVTCDSEKKACTWLAKDYRTDEPVLTTFLAKFSSMEAALEFKTRFDQVSGLTFMHSKFRMNRFIYIIFQTYVHFHTF